MPENNHLRLSLLLTKEAKEVQKTALHKEPKTAGVCAKVPLAGYLPLAHAKKLLTIFTCFTPWQHTGANQLLLLSMVILNE